jgi:hypothetical protein
MDGACRFLCRFSLDFRTPDPYLESQRSARIRGARMRKARTARALVRAVVWVAGAFAAAADAGVRISLPEHHGRGQQASGVVQSRGADLARSANASASPEWLLAVENPRPPTEGPYALAYDSARGRVVFFGSSPPSTWEWDGLTWTDRTPAASPPWRQEHAMTYDSTRGRVVLFAGYGNGSSLADTWEWDGNTWVDRTPATSPAGRERHAMAYDSARGRVVLFGGERYEDDHQVLADTWEWDGSAWTERTPATYPLERASHAMTYDSQRGRVVLFGGYGNTGALADTWEWDGTRWLTRTPATHPSARSGHAIVYDSVRRRVVLFGGASDGIVADTWEWDGNAWRKREPATSPPARYRHAMVYDSVRGRAVVLGGEGGFHDPFADMWEWDGTAWIRKIPSTGPSVRADHAMAYDSARGRVVLFGGAWASNRTWEWDGSTWVDRAPVHAPAPRYSHAMAYDVARERVVLFGGYWGSAALGDTWEWDGNEWSDRTPPTSPPARASHAMAYDSARGRVVLFGGMNDVGGYHYLADTWEWDGSTWTEVTPATSPPAVFRSAMAFDSARRRVVLFAGSFDYGGTWEWDGSAWEEMTPITSPPGRDSHAMAYDSGRGRVVLFGGSNWTESPYLEDTWEWDGTSWAKRTLPTSPAARSSHAMAYDIARNRLVLFGGIGDSGPLGDTWEYGTIEACAHAASVTAFAPGAGGSALGDEALGPPDGNAVSLGVGGQIVLRVDPPIRAGSGADFVVFAKGASSGNPNENYRIEVSDDDATYAVVMDCPGDVCQIDLASVGLAGARYVRITDLPPQNPGPTPPDFGADIDSIVAIHCGPAGSCDGIADGTACDDGNPCSAGDTCANGACVGGPPPSCDDHEPCTDDSCNSAIGCVHSNNVASCDDQDACTVNDQCASGRCTGSTGTDADIDGVPDTCDNCPAIYNPDQSNVCDATSLLASANLSTDGFSADRIDGRDLFVFASTYALCPGDPGYNGLANLDRVPAGSGACVDAEDLHLFLNEFGKSR